MGTVLMISRVNDATKYLLNCVNGDVKTHLGHFNNRQRVIPIAYYLALKVLRFSFNPKRVSD